MSYSDRLVIRELFFSNRANGCPIPPAAPNTATLWQDCKEERERERARLRSGERAERAGLRSGERARARELEGRTQEWREG